MICSFTSCDMNVNAYTYSSVSWRSYHLHVLMKQLSYNAKGVKILLRQRMLHITYEHVMKRRKPDLWSIANTIQQNHKELKTTILIIVYTPHNLSVKLLVVWLQIHLFCNFKIYKKDYKHHTCANHNDKQPIKRSLVLA